MTTAVASRFVFATVPELYPGTTMVCIGGGPSLTKADVDYVKGKGVVIAINDAYRLAPWADVLYACDERWWTWHKGVPGFDGLKFSLQKRAARWPGVQVLNNTGSDGLERKRNGLRTGRNSGFQAMNLAVHLGAKSIVLIGYDMQRTGGKEHWFGDHPNRQASPLGSFRGMFDTIVEPLKALGIKVTNCSRETALTSFPCARLEDTL